MSNCNIMSHSSGVVTRLYPECEDTPASPSVLTWRVVARVVRQLGRSLRSLNIARNTGITIQVIHTIHNTNKSIINYEANMNTKTMCTATD